jgi:hypothetical protein
MASLIALRAELMRGDYRALYLGWLASLSLCGRDDGDRLEPPVPPGLAKLSASLRALADFLRVEDELIQVAAAGSVGDPPSAPSADELARWVKSLPAADKDAYLLRFVADEGDILLRAELSKRFREATAPKGARLASDTGRRTVAQLLAARDALVKEKNRKQAERAAREQARRQREQAEARTKALDALARREPAAWREVETLIAMKRPNDYDRAVTLLVDLRELAERSGRTSEADAQIRELRRRHSSKPSFLSRLDARNLGR